MPSLIQHSPIIADLRGFGKRNEHTTQTKHSALYSDVNKHLAERIMQSESSTVFLGETKSSIPYTLVRIDTIWMDGI